MGKRVFAEERIKLEKDAERFAKLLFRHFQQWRRYATYEQKGEPDDPVYGLKVEVASDHPTISEPLIIYAEPHYVTIRWMRFVREWYQPAADRYLSDILPFLDDLVFERIVFLFKISGNEPAKFVTRRTVPPSAYDVRQLHDIVTAEDGATFLEYSWHGSHDKVI